MEEIRPKDTQERENVNSTNGMQKLLIKSKIGSEVPFSPAHCRAPSLYLNKLYTTI